MIQRSNIVIVNAKENSSTFYNKNKAVFTNDFRRIGGTTNAIKEMLLNTEELKVLMPTILSLSSNSPDWEKTLNNWFYGITINVPERGLKLDTGFVYDIESKLEKVVEFKTKTKDATDEDLANHVESKDKKGNFNVMLNRRYLYGTPINVLHFIWYRYCLVHGLVANDESLIVKSPAKIKFYLQSETDAIVAKKSKSELKNKAILLYAQLLTDETKATNVLFAFRDDSVDVVKLGKTDKHDALRILMEEQTDKFIAVCENKLLEKQSQVEQYIALDIWNRYQGSETIVDALEPAVIIGNSVKEAITFLADEKNKVKVNEYIQKYKSLTT